MVNLLNLAACGLKTALAAAEELDLDVLSASESLIAPVWADWSGLTELILRFLLNVAVISFIVRVFYYPKSKRRDYFFTFLLIAISVFLLIFLMGGVKLKIGFALGLFAIFGIIRYRTESVPIREMTYLFIIIAISAINGLTVSELSYGEVLIINALFFISIWLCESKLLIKEEGIFAGVEIAKQVFHRFDPTMEVEVYIEDGAHVKPGDIVMSVKGKVQSLLQTERLMLNILQRMSGIATMTHKYQQTLIDAGTKTRVLDTRKTPPGMRMLEKEAVKIGGGMNHRIGLFDMILLKDNHIDFCGGVHNAISRAKEYCKANGKDLKIECEVRNWKELDEALAEGCDRIMFDNFTPEDTEKAVKIVAGRCETESSGGITFDNMIPYAKAGVDFISFGALTHSVKGLDMSFKAAGSDKLKI